MELAEGLRVGPLWDTSLMILKNSEEEEDEI